jgi:hypothetical protein
MSKSRSNPLRLVAHMLAAVFNSRAIFHREWKRYASAGATDPVAGRWTGEWISEHNGHRGQLKCVLLRAPPEAYRACFHASYSWLFRVAYVTTLKAVRQDGAFVLTGEENLGSLAGGVYRCEGRITGAQFECKYSCKYDHGLFHLSRLD